jgi:hypothetical protein
MVVFERSSVDTDIHFIRQRGMPIRPGKLLDLILLDCA